jgi:ankyrin repeat protein
MVKYLVDEGANVNARDKDGETLLHHAAIMGKFNTARVLLQCKADVNAKNNRGMTALHYATDFDHRDLMELLLAHSAVPVTTESI